MWPIQLVFLLFIVCRILLSSSSLCNTSSFLTRSVQVIFSSTTFQNFSGISDLLSDVPNFQHHTMLCSKCRTSLFSSLNLSHICWREDYTCCWILLLPRQFDPAHNFTCINCIIYDNSQTVHQLFLMCHNLYWGRFTWDSHYFSSTHIHFYSIASSNFN